MKGRDQLLHGDDVGYREDAEGGTRGIIGGRERSVVDWRMKAGVESDIFDGIRDENWRMTRRCVDDLSFLANNKRNYPSRAPLVDD